MNNLFSEISDVFKAAGIDIFDRLPEEKSERAKFAKLFKRFNLRLEAALIQGFSWRKSTYTETLDDGSETYITIALDEPTYLALLQRYKELASGGGGGMGGDVPFDIDTHIVEINTDAIDANYMNSRFDKFLKLIQQGDAEQAAVDSTLSDLHKSFAMLSPEEQKYANLFIRDVRAGNVEIDPDKTFRDYISGYMKRAEDARIARVVRRLGCQEDRLRDMLDRKVTEENYQEFGKFDELIASVDMDKAQKFFTVVEQQNYKSFKLRMFVSNYLKNFILSGGIDPYADFFDGDRRSKTERENSGQASQSTESPDSVMDDIDSDTLSVHTTVKRKALSQWYSSSKALACMMDTGCFAYVEEKVCLDEPKYIERQAENGVMRLTAYAKEHEEECFLQFRTDEGGKLHYVKLPASIADKEFRYSDFIDDDILKKYGLVNEIASRMLEAIRDMEFGPALKELMSKRICHYSQNLLQSTTGLDKHTISDMWKGESLNKVNVVSACLGIHLPFPVSNSMCELANIIFRTDKPPESNKTYMQLLSLRWASDYSDIYDDLKEEAMEDLIKKPPM